MELDEETTTSKVTQIRDMKTNQSIQTMRSEVSQLTQEIRGFGQREEQGEKYRIRREQKAVKDRKKKRCRQKSSSNKKKKEQRQQEEKRKKRMMRSKK
mmetsp:Transcript_56352/g.65045  ORF Transcript_56352/g.65045 Transcript_56352/m.65045 type:complete len:98 (+) Transcript_56352:341-634(+)